MATSVHLHIGLPKTGTTYLQDVLWGQADRLRKQGVLLPGRGHREHLWAALDVQERTGLQRRHPDAPGSWGRLVEAIAAWPGRAVVTHEFFCGASTEQAARAVADLGEAEVHVVITARHALAMLTAGWQENVKNGASGTVEEIGEGTGPGSEFSWRTWDLDGVLARWGGVVPPERVHVLPIPSAGSAPDQHWRNFATVVGIDADSVVAPPAPRNPSLGVVQVELLRRINEQLTGFGRPVDRGRWIRGFLAEEMLARQQSERLGVPPALVDDARARSERAVRRIRDSGHHVVGDVDSLRVPADVPSVRTPEEIPDAELLDAATRLIADILSEVRTRDSNG